MCLATVLSVLSLRFSVVCNKLFHKVYTLLSHTPHHTKSPLSSRERDRLPLEYSVGDGEVMTLAVSVDFGPLQSFSVARAARRCTPSI